MKIKLLKRLRNDILQNFEYHDGGWSGYYRVIYKGTRYESEIVSGLNSVSYTHLTLPTTSRV